MDQEPGQSLFQPGEQLGININDSQTEREALEEQLRRDHELGNLLTNAFDDLIDDDNQSSFNTTHGVIQNQTDFVYDYDLPHDKKYDKPHEQHCSEQLYRQTECYSIDQLKVLYEARVRENIVLKESNNELNNRLKSQIEKSQQVRVTLENEKSQLAISLNEAHNQIATLKKEHETLIQINNDLKDKLRNEESEKEEISIKLNSAHQLLLDLEERMKNDITGRNETERNNREHLAKLRESYKNDTTRLENLVRVKDEQVTKLTMQLKEQEKANHMILMQKTETIDRLVRNVEESQKNCERITSAVHILNTASASKINEDSNKTELTEMLQKQPVVSDNSSVNRCDINLLTRLQEELKRAIILKNNKQAIITDLEKEILCLKSNIKVINEEIEHYKIEHNINNETIKSLKKEISDVLTKLNDNKKAHNDQIRVLQETIEKHKNDYLKLTSEKNKDISQLEDKIKHLNELFIFQQECKEELTKKEQELIDYKKKNEILQNKVKELSKLIENNQKKDQEVKEKTNVKQDLTELNGTNIKVLENKIEEKTIKIKVLESKLNKYQMKFEELKSKFIETYNEALLDLNAEKKSKEQIHKENTLMNSNVQKLSNELQLLTTALKMKEEMIKNLEVVLEQLVSDTRSGRKQSTEEIGKKVMYCVVGNRGLTGVKEKDNLKQEQHKYDSNDGNTRVEHVFQSNIGGESAKIEKIIQTISNKILNYRKENEHLVTENERCQKALSEANKMEVVYLKRIYILKKALIKFCKEISFLYSQVVRFKSHIQVMNKSKRKPRKLDKNIQVAEENNEAVKTDAANCKKYKTQYESFLEDMQVHLQILINLAK